MKHCPSYNIGDIFVATYTNNTSNVGLIISINKEQTRSYYIEWSSGHKGYYRIEEIYFPVNGKTVKHYPCINFH